MSTTPERHCSDDHWHQCLIAMNAKTDEVKLSLAALMDVAECHHAKGGTVSRDMILKQSKKTVIVRRSALWNLVQEHGKICEMPS